MRRASLEAVRAQVQREEGFRAFVYRDSRGHSTIGYGTNLDAGISVAQGAALLDVGFDAAVADVATALSWTGQLDDVRLGVLIQLRYNLGLTGLLEFQTMLAACRAGQWDAASAALLDSAADHQEPARVRRWAMELKTGVQL